MFTGWHVLRSYVCAGNDSRPSLSFQVVVDHARKNHNVSKGHFGGSNDINVRNDQSGLLNRAGTERNLNKNVEFTVYDDQGRPTILRGAYLITDGGCENLSIFVNPNVNRGDRGSIIWSEFLEAVRKDVECTFSILKHRFHILRVIKFPEQYIVESTFITCSILHNLLLELDGYDIATWELDVNWSAVSMTPIEWDLPDLTLHVDDDDEVVEEIVPFAGMDVIGEIVNNDGTVTHSPGR